MPRASLEAKRQAPRPIGWECSKLEVSPAVGGEHRKVTEALGFLQPVFWVVILLGVMILVHELGHFWAALAVGVKVETFSIGFGPRIWGFHRGDTDFRLSAIPFGGYVRMLGEQAGDENAIDPQSFQAKARWQRAVVIIAGPLMNIILAIGIVTGLYMYEFRKEIDTKNPVITSVKPDSAAAQAGFQGGQAGAVQSNEFRFSVVNESVANKLMSNSGKEFELHYKEYPGAIMWRGISEFIVDSVYSMRDAHGLPTPYTP